MEQRKCGESDLSLSVLGAGCWAFGGGDYWGAQDQRDVTEVVRRSVELGINYFDTAEAYNDGRSEESLGLALQGIPREQVIIGSKISPGNTYPEQLVQHCEASLKRLKTDYIDIYMIHWPIHPHSIRHFTNDIKIIENPPCLSDALETMKKLRQQGKIRHIGVSNFGVVRLQEVIDQYPGVAVNELPYSLLTRAIESEIMPFCQFKGVGVIGYMTLLQGILADIYPTLSDIPVWQRRTRHFDYRNNPHCRHEEAGAEEEMAAAMVQIRSLFRESGCAMADLAVRWAIKQQAITSVLVGARNRLELEANVRAANGTLPDGLFDKLNQATEPLLKKMGISFDYYESARNDRT